MPEPGKTISRVLEKWRKEHESRKQVRQNGHQAREKAKHLRQGRAEQKARAIILLAEAPNVLAAEGIDGKKLGEVNAADLADRAARSFDGIVNSKRRLGEARPG